MKSRFISISEAMKKGSGKVAVRGWVSRARGSNKMKFIVLRDVTNIIQCVIKRDKSAPEGAPSKEGKLQWGEIDKIQVESSLEIEGIIKADKRAPSGFEIEVSNLKIIGLSEEFPLNKDSTEGVQADKRHLHLRSSKMIAIMKIRSRYVQAREEFFIKEKFYRFDTPVLQPTQSEGGSTVFEVKYYNSKSYLAQTWQLYGEAAIFALEKVYNMGPTFRAEKSNTSRHLSEFWMAETEVAWWKLDEIIEFAKKEIKHCIESVAKNCAQEFKVLNVDVKKLLKVAKANWPTIKYREALKILKNKEIGRASCRERV